MTGADLPLGPVLVTLAILTCALVLGHVREVSQRRNAQEKAFTLLKQWLSPVQLAQYEKYGYFEVMGGNSGKHYRIRPTRQMNAWTSWTNRVCGSPHGASAQKGNFRSVMSCWRRRLLLKKMSGPLSP